jgi:hypothetical protein
MADRTKQQWTELDECAESRAYKCTLVDPSYDELWMALMDLPWSGSEKSWTAEWPGSFVDWGPLVPSVIAAASKWPPSLVWQADQAMVTVWLPKEAADWNEGEKTVFALWVMSRWSVELDWLAKPA